MRAWQPCIKGSCGFRQATLKQSLVNDWKWPTAAAEPCHLGGQLGAVQPTFKSGVVDWCK